MIKIIGKILIVGVLAVLFAMPANADEKSMLGRKAPDFELEDIKTGKKVRLSSSLGSRMVVINFWKSR